MLVVIRKYSGTGAHKLFDLMEKHAGEVQSIMGPVKGLISYTLARNGDGGFSVTVCQDQAGIDESNQIAMDWIAKEAADTGVAAPEVITGNVILT